MVSDEPVPRGSDEGPNPVEYLLQALGTCYTVGIATIAAQRGIELESFRLELEADVDLAAFFEVDPSVAPVVSQIRANVFAESSNASREQLDEWIAAIQQASTLRDRLVCPVEVITKVAN
nr:OsmC family protein [Agrobacterium burrii]